MSGNTSGSPSDLDLAVTSSREVRHIAATSWGAGPDVVFLHGLGASARYWDPVASSGDGFHGIAPDLLGFGRSPKPRRASYDVDDHVHAILRLVPDGAVVVGHSTGAVIAAAVAARAPTKVRGLLLISPPLYPDAVTAREEIARFGLLARLTVQQHHSARVLCSLMCAFRPAAMAAAWLLASNVPRAVAADGVRHTWRSYSRTLEQVVVRHRATADLRASQCEVILLHGDEDAVVPAGHLHAFVSGLSSPAITCRVVSGDHHLPLRRPDVVNSAIAELLSRTGASLRGATRATPDARPDAAPAAQAPAPGGRVLP